MKIDNMSTKPDIEWHAIFPYLAKISRCQLEMFGHCIRGTLLFNFNRSLYVRPV